MHIRSLAAADHAELAALCAAGLPLDPYAADYPGMLLRREAVGLVATEEGRLVGAALGSARGADEGSLDLLVVADGHRRRGTARRLVTTLESRLAERGATAVVVEGNAPYYLWPGVDLHYTPAICFFEDSGYERGRSVVNMDVDLRAISLDTADDEKRLLGEGIELREATTADRDGLHAWLSAGSGWPPAGWPPGWADEAVAALGRENAGCHLAVSAGKPVAFCAYGVNQPHIIGPMATDHAVRSRGIGMTLMKRCYADQRERGITVAEISWVGPLSLFSDRLRARIRRCFWQYRKPLKAEVSDGGE
ncbi:GNAT family N-acetyltransferase [Amycolatopsis kentuckyensis]|uniref:GNAT family N-acetyltransferase n=1 Tax=Amycolatopsis kentuckyensis TaxID=218823 RepID=UPI0013027660|nr:GNAT family N-acetyltransferase [Amycolatopsis kentuckyensis]